MIKPISPSEIGSYKAKVFPPEVLEAVNELIAENYTNRSADVKQKHIIERILQKMNGDVPVDEYIVTRHDVFEKGWLNFEEIYRDAGWKVEYDKPAYNESYDASFTFKVK